MAILINVNDIGVSSMSVSTENNLAESCAGLHPAGYAAGWRCGGGMQCRQLNDIEAKT